MNNHNKRPPVKRRVKCTKCGMEWVEAIVEDRLYRCPRCGQRAGRVIRWA